MVDMKIASLTAEITAAFVGNRTVPTSDVPRIVRSVDLALRQARDKKLGLLTLRGGTPDQIQRYWDAVARKERAEALKQRGLARAARKAPEAAQGTVYDAALTRFAATRK